MACTCEWGNESQAHAGTKFVVVVGVASHHRTAHGRKMGTPVECSREPALGKVAATVGDGVPVPHMRERDTRPSLVP